MNNPMGESITKIDRLQNEVRTLQQTIIHEDEQVLIMDERKKLKIRKLQREVAHLREMSGNYERCLEELEEDIKQLKQLNIIAAISNEKLLRRQQKLKKTIKFLSEWKRGRIKRFFRWYKRRR